MNFKLSSTSLFVIGKPVGHSLSPRMHQSVLDELGLDFRYEALEIPSSEDLPSFFEAMRFSSIRGVNVTVPYKEAVIPYLDRLDTAAQRCGAVNTIVNEDGILKGYNTDGLGFLVSLKEDLALDVSDKKVVIIGAGGAARGISDALCESGVSELTILNRTIKNAESLRYDLESGYKLPIYVGSSDVLKGSSEWDHLEKADIIIQATSVGLDVENPSLPISSVSWVRKGQFCIDIIYKPRVTAFLAQTQALGATILNGAGMLAGQGAIAFTLFTGKQANYHTMKKEVLND